MSFIEIPLGDVVDKVVLPEAEYDLLIERAKELDDGEAVLCVISVEGHPEAKAVFHRLSFPLEGDDEDKAEAKLRFTKGFLDLFDVGYEDNGFEADDLPGATATAFLKQDEYEGNISNQIKLSV